MNSNTSRGVIAASFAWLAALAGPERLLTAGIAAIELAHMRRHAASQPTRLPASAGAGRHNHGNDESTQPPAR